MTTQTTLALILVHSNLSSPCEVKDCSRNDRQGYHKIPPDLKGGLQKGDNDSLSPITISFRLLNYSPSILTFSHTMIRCISVFLLMSLMFLESTSAFNAPQVSMQHPFQHTPWSTKTTHKMIGTGFSFEDGEQILVSVQKPLGVVLEQDDNGIIQVTEVQAEGAAGRAGVQVADVLVAVQNASVQNVDLDSVLSFIQSGPRVMNLRFKRM